MLFVHMADVCTLCISFMYVSFLFGDHFLVVVVMLGCVIWGLSSVSVFAASFWCRVCSCCMTRMPFVHAPGACFDVCS